MKRDAKRCDGDDPVGVDLANAKALRLHRRSGRGVPVPVPQRLLHAHATRRPTPGLRLNLNPTATPANSERGPHRSDRHQRQRRLQPRRADRPPRARRWTRRRPWRRPAPSRSLDEGASFDAKQPVVLIDADTGERQLIWAELDSQCDHPGGDRPADPPGEEPRRRPPLHRRPATPQERCRARRSRRPRASASIATTSRPASRRSRSAASTSRACSSPSPRRRSIAATSTSPGTSPSPARATSPSACCRSADDGLAQLGDTTPGRRHPPGPRADLHDHQRHRLPVDPGADDRPRRPGHPHGRGHDHRSLLPQPGRVPVGIALHPRQRTASRSGSRATPMRRASAATSRGQRSGRRRR